MNVGMEDTLENLRGAERMLSSKRTKQSASTRGEKIQAFMCRMWRDKVNV